MILRARGGGPTPAALPPGAQIFAFAVGPGGKTIASGSEDNTVLLWQLGAHGDVPRVAATPAGYLRLVAAWIDDGSIRGRSV